MITATAFSMARKRRDVRILARMITLAENDPAAAYRVLADVGTRTESSHVVGFTGPPGVGKSTLVSALVGELRRTGTEVAVIAVDPSSPFNGGALLGDRIRMNAHANDPGVYIRSMATRGVLGGLSRAAWVGVRVLAAWGFRWIIVETAGVGQSEIDVVDLAETTVLVLSPGAGDEVQVMKAGIMEVADLFVINKADLPGAERTANALRAVLLNGAHTSGEPQILSTVSTAPRGASGVAELAAALTERSERLEDSGRLATIRSRRRRTEVRRAALALFARLVDHSLAESASQPLPDPSHGDPLAQAWRMVERIVSPDGARFLKEEEEDDGSD